MQLTANLDFPKAAVVATEWSAISRGTERLVFEGRVPESEWARMRAPHQDGEFPFPVKYGYAAAGIVEDGPQELVGKAVFALHPHQTRFVLPAEALTLVPKAVPLRRATLAANMETALNAVWDGAPGPGDQILVIGGGLLGLLVAAICARLPGSAVTVCDIAPERRPFAEAMGAAFALPEHAPGEQDIVFHTSATEAGLALAIEKAGFEASIVELSWFGAGATRVPLGGAFHSRRLRLLSSQVGHVSASRRARWSHHRRLAAALSLLADPVFDALITEEVPFEELPQRLPEILAADAPGLVTVVKYAKD